MEQKKPRNKSSNAPRSTIDLSHSSASGRFGAERRQSESLTISIWVSRLVRDSQERITVWQQSMEATMKWSAIVILSVLLGACSTGDQMTLPRAAVTTGNMEMIGNGLQDFLGRDSSGLAALDAVKPFQESIEQIYREYQRSARKMLPEVPLPSKENQPLMIVSMVETIRSAPSDQAGLYANLLNGVAKSAEIKMDSCFEAFRSDRSILNAKKAFAAGFFALQGKGYSGVVRMKMTEMYDSIAARTSVTRASD